jgi:hypothetical protein
MKNILIDRILGIFKETLVELEQDEDIKINLID